MGRYIDDILQPGEKVLYSTNAHWIFFLPAILGWIVAAAFFVGSRHGVGRGGDEDVAGDGGDRGDFRAVQDGDRLVPPLDHRDRRHQSARRPQDGFYQAARPSR